MKMKDQERMKKLVLTKQEQGLRIQNNFMRKRKKSLENKKKKMKKMKRKIIKLEVIMKMKLKLIKLKRKKMGKIMWSMKIMKIAENKFLIFIIYFW